MRKGKGGTKGLMSKQQIFGVEDWMWSHLALWAPLAGSEPRQECSLYMWPSCQVWQVFLRLKCIKTGRDWGLIPAASLTSENWVHRHNEEPPDPSSIPPPTPASPTPQRQGTQANWRGLQVTFQHTQREAALHRPGDKLAEAQMSFLQQCVCSF